MDLRSSRRGLGATAAGLLVAGLLAAAGTHTDAPAPTSELDVGQTAGDRRTASTLDSTTPLARELAAAASPSSEDAGPASPSSAPVTSSSEAADAPIINRPPPRPNRSAPPSAAAPHAPATPAPGSRAVFERDLPDPSVLLHGGTYWAVSTGAHWLNVPVARSVDLRSWEHVGDALPHLPDWSEAGYVWAPSVLPRGPGAYVLTYTTRHAAWGLQCISQALSPLPQGPYVDTSDGPLICQTERGGSIDPEPFVDDDGTPWLTWKSEGTLQGEPTRIWIQRLAHDGRSLLGEPTELLHTVLAWEHPIVEGPHLVRIDGIYHLFFSAGRWETEGYAIGHAICDTVTGPCRRTGTAPLLASDQVEAGPGAPGVVRSPTGEPVLTYHAWTKPHVGYPAGARRLHLAALHISDDRPTVVRPWRPTS